jgi:hypothetical protein
MTSERLGKLILKGIKKGLPSHEESGESLTTQELEYVYSMLWFMHLLVKKVERFSGPTNFVVTLPSGATGVGSTLLEALVDTRK